MTPAVVLAVLLILSQAIVVFAWDSRAMVAVGAMLFALAIVGADLLVSQRRGKSSGPSKQALLVAGAFLMACGVSTLADPHALATLLPLLAGGAATPVLLRSEKRC